jgi:hypothetical protein
MDCMNKKENARRCACTYPGCPRHGMCCECVSYHAGNGELPGCLFTPREERSYDRSIASFVAARR